MLFCGKKCVGKSGKFMLSLNTITINIKYLETLFVFWVTSTKDTGRWTSKMFRLKMS